MYGAVARTAGELIRGLELKARARTREAPEKSVQLLGGYEEGRRVW
jgi:hypothetical protein